MNVKSNLELEKKSKNIEKKIIVKSFEFLGDTLNT